MGEEREGEKWGREMGEEREGREHHMTTTVPCRG